MESILNWEIPKRHEISLGCGPLLPLLTVFKLPIRTSNISSKRMLLAFTSLQITSKNQFYSNIFIRKQFSDKDQKKIHEKKRWKSSEINVHIQIFSISMLSRVVITTISQNEPVYHMIGRLKRSKWILKSWRVDIYIYM